MSVTAVCPGSFDPVTLGHLDVIRRAAPLVDELVVTVVENPSKQGLFTIEERLALIDDQVADLPGVRVARFQGLLVDHCRDLGASVIVKGVRGAEDVDYELQMAHMNRRLTGVETVLLPADPSLSHVSSSLVKEIARLGGDIGHTVPTAVRDALLARLATA